MRKLLLIFFLLMLSVLTVSAQDISLEERGYLIYIPSTYEADNPMPLVITLHGYGDTAQGYAQGTGWAETAEEYGFIVGFLNGYLREWNSGHRNSGHTQDDTAAIIDFIEFIADEVRIDRERIYLVGFSNGASMAYRAACESPDTFEAIVAVAGWMNYYDCSEEAQTSVLVIHGTADATVPFGGGDRNGGAPGAVRFWADLNNCVDEDVPELPRDYAGLQIQFFNECDDNNLVMLYGIPGFGHSWPGAYQRSIGRPVPHELDANFIIWGFFEVLRQNRYAAESRLPEDP